MSTQLQYHYCSRYQQIARTPPGLSRLESFLDNQSVLDSDRCVFEDAFEHDVYCFIVRTI
jgi:predicted RNA binding protein with dsRBD fold (UPF0201 family)